MGKKSFLLLIIALSIMVSGCGKFYNRDTRPGEIIKISMEEMETMMKEKETFTLVVTRDYCKYCAEIIEKKFSQQNKVLGNIEKFAENQGLQTFFFNEKVS